MSDRKWSSVIIKREDSQWLLFGMPISGGWLPSAAFNTGISYDDVMNPTEKIKVQYFKMSWMLSGWAVIYKVTVTPMFQDLK
tara:strand:- start:1625 stop:1870 length:246 start_codon:yes stop_codon:yes gene_type:complete